MSKEDKRYGIEDRLIDFAVRIIKLFESLSKTKVGSHIANQIIRSGTAPATNYGEAQGAESQSDFIRKMKICLKELRETIVRLKMIIKANLIKPESKVKSLIDENDQLISILVKSIKTAMSKNKKIFIIRNSLFNIGYSFL